MSGKSLTYIASIIVVVLLATITLVYDAGKRYGMMVKQCPPADTRTADSLRVAAAGLEERLAATSAEKERLQATVDSIEALPKPTIATRVTHAYARSITGPLVDRIKRLDAAPDSL